MVRGSNVVALGHPVVKGMRVHCGGGLVWV
jgi:hypothetical protein